MRPIQSNYTFSAPVYHQLNRGSQPRQLKRSPATVSPSSIGTTLWQLMVCPVGWTEQLRKFLQVSVKHLGRLLQRLVFSLKYPTMEDLNLW